MNESFKVVVVIFGAWTLLLFALWIYLGWLWLRLACHKRSAARPPEVERDHTGRPLKERV